MDKILDICIWPLVAQVWNYFDSVVGKGSKEVSCGRVTGACATTVAFLYLFAVNTVKANTDGSALESSVNLMWVMSTPCLY
jgi:hypothetical protein